MNKVSDELIQEGIQIGRGEGIEIGRDKGIEIGRGEGIEIGTNNTIKKIAHFLMNQNKNLSKQEAIKQVQEMTEYDG